MNIVCSTKNMSPFLLIAAAVWYGFCASRLRCFKNNRTNPTKVDHISDYRCKKLEGEILYSPNDEDRLFELPNDILSHILTRLTLRDVFKMTILSKKWKNIWTLLQKLDLEWQVMTGDNGFCCEKKCKPNRQTYVKRVNKVLQKYEFLDISSFRISACFSMCYPNHADYWTMFASKKGLESLTLQFDCSGHDLALVFLKKFRPEVMYVITSSFLSQFSCLKNLRLDSCTLKLHSDFRFNKLVRLDLYYVFLEGNQLQWLLSNSSTIEWLRIRWCNLPEKLRIGDNLQRLSYLVIHEHSDLLELELIANSLNFFDFVGKASVKLSILSAAKLESSNVALLDKNYQGAERIFRDLATSLPSLETLLLQGLYFSIHVLPSHPSTLFRRVVRLSLFFQNEDHEVDTVKSFPRLLNSFPQLQKLYLQVPRSIWARSYKLPDVCLNTSLKEVELGNFKMDWIPCANYFLKCTAMLDRMLISCHSNIFTRDGEWERTGGCFSQQESDYIRFALQGNALSPSADLIIQ